MAREVVAFRLSEQDRAELNMILAIWKRDREDIRDRAQLTTSDVVRRLIAEERDRIADRYKHLQKGSQEGPPVEKKAKRHRGR